MTGRLVAAVLVAAAALPGPSLAVAGVVNNSAVTFDTVGARLDAHDGTVVQDLAGTAWLFGTSYGCGFTLGRPSPWCGVRVYRSTDLQTWTPAGAVGGMLAFDPYGPEWQARCGGDQGGCFRPHVARRPDGTWVMWINVAHDPAGYAVLTAPAAGGPYAEVSAPPVLAVTDGSGAPFGDLDITPDSADPAVAWIAYTAIDHTGGGNLHDIVVERLDPTWTTGTGQWTRLGKTLVEAPGLFRRGDTWYLTYSDPACPYCSATGTSYATAASPAGPWTVRGQISGTSCQGQPADVDSLRGPSGALYYVWQVDRWVSGPGGALIRNQYAANNYLAPLTFASAGGIPGQPCTAQWMFT